MKKCIIMFALFVAALAVAGYSDGKEQVILEKDMALEQNIHLKELAHQSQTNGEMAGGDTSYGHLKDGE